MNKLILVQVPKETSLEYDSGPRDLVLIESNSNMTITLLILSKVQERKLQMAVKKILSRSLA